MSIRLKNTKTFLNLFHLALECDDPTLQPINILNSDGTVVGILSMNNNEVEIRTQTAIGLLTAVANIEAPNHSFHYFVQGDPDFKGNTQIVEMPNDIKNACRLHTTIQYKDKDGNDAELKVSEENALFIYTVEGKKYREELEIRPWGVIRPYMSHKVVKGDWSSKHPDGLENSLKLVCKDPNNPRNYLISITDTTINGEEKEHDIQHYFRVPDDQSKEAMIEKGIMIHRIDPDFAKKIQELIDLFKRGNVSFLENLIDASIDINMEAKRTMFGVPLKEKKKPKSEEEIYYGSVWGQYVKAPNN